MLRKPRTWLSSLCNRRATNCSPPQASFRSNVGQQPTRKRNPRRRRESRPDGWSIGRDVLNLGSVIALTALAFGLLGFARIRGDGFLRGSSRVVLGVLHLAVHVAAVGVVTIAVLTADGDGGLADNALLATGLAGLAACAVGFALAPIISAIYLLVSNLEDGARFETEISGPLSNHEGRHNKNFLRMQIDQAGRLTTYPIGLDRTPAHKQWRPSPEKESWFDPTVELPAPHLIDAPIEALPE